MSQSHAGGLGPLIEELSLDLGARRSDYDGFGGVNTWKADMNMYAICSSRLS